MGDWEGGVGCGDRLRRVSRCKRGLSKPAIKGNFMFLQSMLTQLTKLSLPHTLCITIIISTYCTAHFQLIDLPLSLPVWKYFDWSFLTRGTRTTVLANLVNTSKTKVVATAVGQVCLSLYCRVALAQAKLGDGS